MLRFVVVIVASSAAMTALALTACSGADTNPAPDAAPPPCDQGPFAFGLLPGDDTTTPGCSADNSTLPVIQKLPRGGRYAVKSKVNYVGTRDQQGDCKLDVVCTCDYPSATTEPEPVTDAGADAAATPPPASGEPVWTCQ